MGKKGVAQISGVVKPILGETYTYSVTGWYPDTEPEKRNPNNVTWELFKQRSLGKFTTTNIRKKGISSFTFGEKAVGSVYKLQAYLYEPEGGGLIITPQPAKIPKIDKVELFYVDDKKGSTFSFMEKLRARAYCVNMLKKELVFTLWEDDAKGEGHNANNKLIETRKAKVDKNGIAVTEFMLSKALMKKAMQGETDPKQLEFYVTVEYYSHKKHATDNININNPLPPIKHEVPVKPRGVPKAKGSPAASKPASKKEERGILENVRDWWKDFDLWDWGESSGTIKKDKPPTVQKPDGKSPAIVKGEKKPTSSCICKEQYKELAWGGKVSCEFRKKVVQICSELWGESRKMKMADGLMAVMNVETRGSFKAQQLEGWRSVKDPKSMTIADFRKDGKRESSRAIGLIQFTQDALQNNLKEYVSNPKLSKAEKFDELNKLKLTYAQMGEIQQLDKVKKYFNSQKDSIKSPEDIYLAVFAPSGIGKNDSFILYRGGTREYNANASVDTKSNGRYKNDGNIQRSEILERFHSSLKEGKNSNNLPSTFLCNSNESLPSVAAPPTQKSGMLSKYLSYNQAIKSDTASRNKLDNTPNKLEIENLKHLGLNIYDKIYEKFNGKVKLTSVFRSEKVNKKVGGSSTSQHRYGQALDIQGTNGVTNKQIFKYVKENLNYHQIIWEYGSASEPNWVHVGCKPVGNQKKNTRAIRGANGKTQYINFNLNI
ncbi:D-Ala-D-Ala carboxypeptidase family metallohydrolase [Chryseobacterium sp. M5]|uniref:D-Ala-D-Ala carboxypeptidase family metallohydrolase n=1 Tax=Chryseobacterium sp. M5 TaxID=3379128 RepID=UPI0038578817